MGEVGYDERPHAPSTPCSRRGKSRGTEHAVRRNSWSLTPTSPSLGRSPRPYRSNQPPFRESVEHLVSVECDTQRWSTGSSSTALPARSLVIYVDHPLRPHYHGGVREWSSIRSCRTPPSPCLGHRAPPKSTSATPPARSGKGAKRCVSATSPPPPFGGPEQSPAPPRGRRRPSPRSTSSRDRSGSCGRRGGGYQAAAIHPTAGRPSAPATAAGDHPAPHRRHDVGLPVGLLEDHGEWPTSLPVRTSWLQQQQCDKGPYYQVVPPPEAPPTARRKLRGGRRCRGSKARAGREVPSFRSSGRSEVSSRRQAGRGGRCVWIIVSRETAPRFVTASQE